VLIDYEMRTDLIDFERAAPIGNCAMKKGHYYTDTNTKMLVSSVHVPVLSFYFNFNTVKKGKCKKEKAFDICWAVHKLVVDEWLVLAVMTVCGCKNHG